MPVLVQNKDGFFYSALRIPKLPCGWTGRMVTQNRWQAVGPLLAYFRTYVLC